MAKTIFEEMGGKYERQGDYLIPCLTVPAEEEQPIGIWGQRNLDYLKHHCKVTYTNLLTSGRRTDSCVCSDNKRNRRDSTPGSQHEPGCNRSAGPPSDGRCNDGRYDEGR